MRLKSIFLINKAPFKRLYVDFDSENIGLFSGINGAGKTTVISYLIDSFYELARVGYTNEFEAKANKYYRISSRVYSLDISLPSIVYIRYIKSDNSYVDYIDICGDCTSEEYDDYLKFSDKIPFSSIKNDLSQTGAVKHWSITNGKEIRELFENNLFTYFPSYRYEKPAYLNEPYEFRIDFNKYTNYFGYLPNMIEVTSDLPRIVNWIMDIVLDRRLSDKTASTLYECLNDILDKILSKKIGRQIRLGIGPRNSGATRIAVIDRLDEKSLIYPSIFNMSSGELSLLCLFGELLKQADRIGETPDSVKGIVLIDEIDKHLHIKLQKEILPKLFSLFPNLQFIISSHSPFLGLGLEDESTITYKLYDLDNGGMVSYPLKTDLFRELYLMILSENDNFERKYEELQKSIEQNNKPLVITEGKTDWKHLRAAINKLNIDDLDVDIYEYEDALGDKTLLQLLMNFSKFSRQRKIIGIFDRDNFVELKRPDLEKEKYVSFQNNVFAFAIPPANGDEYGTDISIEHYYKLCDMTKPNIEGRRLFLGSEFYNSGLSRDRKYHTRTSGIEKKVSINGVIDEKVYDINLDPEEKNSVALSKNAFAELILHDEHYSEGVDFSEFRKIFDIIKMILLDTK